VEVRWAEVREIAADILIVIKILRNAMIIGSAAVGDLAIDVLVVQMLKLKRIHLLLQIVKKK
jgi:hypothetical protein